MSAKQGVHAIETRKHWHASGDWITDRSVCRWTDCWVHPSDLIARSMLQTIWKHLALAP